MRAPLPLARLAPGPPGVCRPLLSPITAVLRDVQRGRDLEQILTQYTTFVKPAFEEFCLPVPPSTCPGTSFPPLSEGPLVPILRAESWTDAVCCIRGEVSLSFPQSQGVVSAGNGSFVPRTPPPRTRLHPVHRRQLPPGPRLHLSGALLIHCPHCASPSPQPF